MIGVLRQTLLLAVSAALSWWIFLGLERPEPTPSAPRPQPLPVVLTPVPLQAEQAARPEPQPREVAAAPAPPPAPVPEPESTAAALELPEPEPQPAPPPPELGAPDAEGELAAAEAEPEAEPDEPREEPTEPAEATGVSAEEAMADEQLVAAARTELSGDVRPGFATVLVAAPEEQLAIARFFGEEIVLVPKSALDTASDGSHYFHLVLAGTPRIESVAGTAALEGYRQYRDLFDYEYARLPAPLRELRRSVLSRNEIYLFGALIPAREWAVVIQRRREALEQSGRALADTQRFVLQYRPRARGGFDLEVDEIVFADGTRFRPINTTPRQETP